MPYTKDFMHINRHRSQLGQPVFLLTKRHFSAIVIHHRSFNGVIHVQQKRLASPGLPRRQTRRLAAYRKRRGSPLSLLLDRRRRDLATQLRQADRRRILIRRQRHVHLPDPPLVVRGLDLCHRLRARIPRDSHHDPRRCHGNAHRLRVGDLGVHVLHRWESHSQRSRRTPADGQVCDRRAIRAGILGRCSDYELHHLEVLDPHQGLHRLHPPRSHGHRHLEPRLPTRPLLCAVARPPRPQAQLGPPGFFIYFLTNPAKKSSLKRPFSGEDMSSSSGNIIHINMPMLRAATPDLHSRTAGEAIRRSLRALDVFTDPNRRAEVERLGSLGEDAMGKARAIMDSYAGTDAFGMTFSAEAKAVLAELQGRVGTDSVSQTIALAIAFHVTLRQLSNSLQDTVDDSMSAFAELFTAADA